MSFKFNWGTGIFMFIGLFLLSMAALIYFSLQERFDLVETEYYPQSLEYQKQIDRIAMTGKLSEKIMISQEQDLLKVKFPAELKGKEVKGLIYMFRPSDQDADFTDSIKTDTGMIQRIPIAELKAGRYIAKISWSMDGKEYYFEEGVRIVK
ncbi:MAG: FixH family protein [Bacteroidales bacterium]|nr:FixH family protein [Bacteroidales bacterium]